MGNKTTTTKTELPAFQQQAIEGLFGKAATAQEAVAGEPIYAQRGADQLLADQLVREQGVAAQGAGTGSRDIARQFTGQLTGGTTLDPSLTAAGPTSQTALDPSLFTEGPQVGGILDPALTGTSARDDAIAAAINPLQRRLMEQILPGVQSSAIAAGSEGGAREQINLASAIEQGFTNPALEAAQRISFQDLLSRRDLGVQEAGLSAQDLAGRRGLAVSEAGLQQGDVGLAQQDLAGRRQLGVQEAGLEQNLAQLIPGLEQAAVQLGLLPAELFDLIGGRGQEERQNILDAAQQQPFAGLPELAAIILNSVGGSSTAGTSSKVGSAFDKAFDPFGIFT